MATNRRRLLVPAIGLVLLSGCSASSPAGSAAVSHDGGSSVTPPTHDAGAVTGRDAGAVVAPTGDAAVEAPTPEAGGSEAATDASGDASAIPPLPGWTLTWSDEFNLPDGSPVDTANWTQETGNAGWDNNHELEYYTPGTANAVIQGGSLVITATPEGAS